MTTTEAPTRPVQDGDPYKGSTVLGEESRTWRGAPLLSLWTLLMSWVLSPLMVLALFEQILNWLGVPNPLEGHGEWSLFQGSAIWFADTLEVLWIFGDMHKISVCMGISVASIWLLDRQSKWGLRVGVSLVTLYFSGTWYAQNYTWYPDWAAWSGSWIDVWLVALFSTATLSGRILWKSVQEHRGLKGVPHSKILVHSIPVSTVMYGSLLASTNAAF